MKSQNLRTFFIIIGVYILAAVVFVAIYYFHCTPGGLCFPDQF
ncbi:hypothetical protein [Geomonas sp. Red276]